MHYTVTNHSNRHFEVYDEHNTSLGTLDYTSWLPNKAQITTVAHLQYDIAPEGFWQTTMTVTQNDRLFASIKPNWGMGLHLMFAAQAHPCIFKKKGFLNNDYVMLDVSGHEIALVRSDFKWKTLSFHYEIDIHPNAFDKEVNLVLPLLITYIARYMRMRHAAVV